MLLREGPEWSQEVSFLIWPPPPPPWTCPVTTPLSRPSTQRQVDKASFISKSLVSQGTEGVFTCVARRAN